MIDIPVYNLNGEKTGSYQLDEQKLGGEVRHALLKQALVMYHANQRQGTVRTLARGEVEGSTRKIYKQKGTGNARMGPVRNPVRRGGGHAKQKRPKDWRLAMPKKQRRLARDSAILAKVQSQQVLVLDDLQIKEPKTKHVAALYKALKIDRSCLVALHEPNDSVVKAARNIPATTLTTVDQLNAWDVLQNKTLLVTRAGLEQILA